MESNAEIKKPLVGPLLNSSEAAQWTPGAQLFDELQTLRAGQAEARLAAIVESSDDAIISKDLNGIIESWNGGAERIFGYSSDEMVGKSIRLIIPSDRQHEEDGVLSRVRAGERIDHFETVRRRKDGTFVDISVTVSPIRNHAGEIVGASKIARDISERKRAEIEINAAAALKDQFLSLVPHELRTPITTVVANALILLRRRDLISPEDAEQALQDIASEGARLQTVIENLLLLTSVEASGLNLEPVSLRHLSAERVSLFLRSNPSRTVEIAGEGPMGPVNGQPELLAMVIENLLSNAAKYSGPEATIVVASRLNEHGEAEMTVRDNGIGVEDSELPNLFTPYYRAGAARAYAKGMGIGLAVCKRIVEAHGGRIWATSRPEGGTDFTFTLPLHEEAAESEAG